MLRRAACTLLTVAALIASSSVLLVFALRHVDPPFSAFMIWDRFSRTPGESGGPLEHQWAPLHDISPHLRLAVVAAEDQKFPDHAGFDVEAIRTVLEARLEGDPGGGAMRGASTISQQVAKNLFLWAGRSLLRKGIEAGITVLIEALWPKSRILEVYLNVAQFGDDVYGAEAAARRFFGKPARALDAHEAALMASVLPNPVRLSVARPSTYVRKRQRWILGQMRQLGGTGFLDRIAP